MFNEDLFGVCMELRDELYKYKRAFEILKDSELIHFFKYEETDIYEIITGDGTQILTKEEYELLEELMKDAKD